MILPVIVLGFLCNFCLALAPIATTEQGRIQGKILITPNGECDAYLGVPFAEPPIGDLRWKKPHALNSWQGVKDATQFAATCIQGGSNGTVTTESEDCLYLNVFIPKSLANSSTQLPVMVYIHGGGFTIGSARAYGADGICENLATRGVIVVVIQYRLFMYGFLSSGDSEATGNYAIWDQIEALKWVNLNIGHFGGDPKKVTIFGESAGGASVSYLSYTPVAKDYFIRSITQSGSALSYWAQPTENAAATAKRLARAANCSEDSESYMKCLRQLSTSDLQNLFNTMIPVNQQDYFSQWGARVDDELFTKAEMTELNSGKSAIIGVNTAEFPRAEVKDIPIADEVFNATLDSLFNGTNTVKNEILKQITRYFYIDSKGDSNNKTFVAQQAYKITRDRMFHVGSPLEAVSKAASGNPVWVYDFDFYFEGEYEKGDPFEKGAPHAHDLCYVFLLIGPQDEFVICPDTYDGHYRTVANHFGEMWTNFAKIGNPSPTGLEWPRFRNLTSANAMEIRPTLNIAQMFYVATAYFWGHLIPSVEKMF